MNSTPVHELEAMADRAADRALDKFFIRLGVDTSDPIAMQKDFAYLRSWRESTEMVRRKGLMVATGIVFTSLCGIIYAALLHR